MIISKGSSSIPTSKVETREGIKINNEIILAKVIFFLEIFFPVDFKKIVKEISMKIGAIM